MKSVVVASGNLEDYQKVGTDSFLLPLTKFSVSYEKTYKLPEIKELTEKKVECEFFVVINKMIFDEEMEKLIEILKELEKMRIAGIFFYDLSLLELKKDLLLKTPFVWNNTHMVTNFKTCDYYLKQGVKYAVMSGELSKEEILNLVKKTKIKLFYTLLSYPVIAHSRRKLLSNYAKSNGIKKDSSLMIHEKIQKQDYLVTENNEGTSFFYYTLPNYFSMLKELNVDYVILNEDFIDHTIFLQLLELTNQYLQQKISVNALIEKVEKQIGNHAPFLENKTIYRVKKEGK